MTAKAAVKHTCTGNYSQLISQLKKLDRENPARAKRISYEKDK